MLNLLTVLSLLLLLSAFVFFLPLTFLWYLKLELSLMFLLSLLRKGQMLVNFEIRPLQVRRQLCQV